MEQNKQEKYLKEINDKLNFFFWLSLVSIFGVVASLLIRYV